MVCSTCCGELNKFQPRRPAIPVYDFICSSDPCHTVTEKIVGSYDTASISCPKCGQLARKALLGEVPSAKRHVGVYFNYLAND